MRKFLKILEIITITFLPISSTIACSGQNKKELYLFQETYKIKTTTLNYELETKHNFTYRKMQWTTNENKKVMAIVTDEIIKTPEEMLQFIQNELKIQEFTIHQEINVLLNSIKFLYCQFFIPDFDKAKLNLNEIYFIKNLDYIR